jgi:uracil phosphoribosyltransferase
VLKVLEHPLLAVHISRLRARETEPDAFRRHLTAITRLLAYPALADLPLTPYPLDTPLAEASGHRLSRVPVLVPVLRAGLGMVEGFLDLVPDAIVSHLGLYRDHVTKQPVRYYTNFPAGLADHPVLLLDPMLATGGSAVDALTVLKEEGVRDLRLIIVIAAPEGIQHVTLKHPDVDIYAAAVDERLNDQAYIVPGLGDAGDRQFGTLP